MKKEDSGNNLWNEREKARSNKRERGNCQLPDPFLSLRSKDGRTGAKRNACQKEKKRRRGRGEGRG